MEKKMKEADAHIDLCSYTGQTNRNPAHVSVPKKPLETNMGVLNNHCCQTL